MINNDNELRILLRVTKDDDPEIWNWLSKISPRRRASFVRVGLRNGLVGQGIGVVGKEKIDLNSNAIVKKQDLNDNSANLVDNDSEKQVEISRAFANF